MSVTVTDTAAREIDSIIRAQGLEADKIRLRVGVKGGGCSGFSYLLDLTEVQKDTDEVWDFRYRRGEKTFEPLTDSNVGESNQGGVATATAQDVFTLRVICDPKSYLYLNGTVIDFRDELMQRGFVFNNPNATTTCGCGSSFSA
ncbi:MAG: iron-sulfur cluster assembly accessory protein [Phycisphaerae bacterium]|nr:iron-sulfur cluster assembly accessory protein [Phycisphaerae bacterium]